MGALDNLKDKAKDVAGRHNDKVDQGIEKAGDAVEAKLDGKHSDKVGTGVTKAQEGVDKFAGGQ